LRSDKKRGGREHQTEEGRTKTQKGKMGGEVKPFFAWVPEGTGQRGEDELQH